MRFHVETLLGQRSGERVLPKAASAEEKKAWMCQESLDAFKFNVEHDLLPSGPEEGDPNFPYKDGPGHTNSTPQQLSVMWQMMQTVGVSSFRPDFSRNQFSKDNKWLWIVGEKIFIKLVEGGEYSGVPLGVDGIAAIKKSLKSHIQTLMKRFVSRNFLLFDLTRLYIKKTSHVSYLSSQVLSREMGCRTKRGSSN